MKKPLSLITLTRKVTFFMLLCSICTIFATTARAQKVTLPNQKKSMKEVMGEIERQTGYKFFYNNNQIDLNRDVNISTKDTDMKKVLEKLFSGTNISYKLVDKTIVLTVTETKPNTKNNSTSQNKINGTITDANGAPIIGVTVMEKGTTNGAVTDLDGNFSFTVGNNAELNVSFIGFQSQTIKAVTGHHMLISMKEDTKMLDEVVVVGYGTLRKSDLTGSVSRANLDLTKNAPNASLTSSLQGAIPGLNIGQVNRAGGAANIEVRGQMTLSGNRNVLIVLDGIIYNGTMASINPADIASVDVLKDASSKAIYGASAANGVILITTKKGQKQDKPVVNFNTNISSQTPSVRLHPLNREQKIRSIYDYYWNNGGYVLDSNGNYVVNKDFNVASKIEATQVEGYNNGTDYNWLNNGIQDSYLMNYQLSVSNATEKTQYYLSGGYTKQEGWVKDDSFNRKNVRVNVETNVFDWLKIGTNAFGSFMDYSGASPSLNNLYLYSPLNKPYDNNGQLIYIPNGTLENPFTCFDAKNKNLQNSISALAYATIDFPFLKGLNYRVNWGNNYNWSQYYYSNIWGANNKGNAFKNNSSTYDYTIDHILNYKTVIAQKHHIDLTAVAGMRAQSYEFTTASGEQYSDISLGYNSLEQATIQKIGSDAWREQYLYQMGRVNYNYDDKYLVTATLRRDGFSGFSKDNRNALFPSFAAGWVISRESFFKVPSVDNLKLRVSYGSNGNLTSRYSTMARMASSTYVFGDGGSTSYAQIVSSMASKLKWESTVGMNYGFDLSLFKSRFNLTFDYYDMNTKNLLWNVSIPSITGFSSIATNIGQINNKGIEFTISGTPVQTKEWSWNLGLNFSKNKNKIVKLLGDLNGDGKEDDLVADGLFVGKSINAIYDYNIIGLWSTQEEKDGLIPSGTYVGCEKIEDLNKDGKIDASNDRKILGTKDPSFRLSLSNSLTYKNITLTALFNSVVGGSRSYLGANNALANLGNNSGDNFIKHNMFAEIDYWRPDNQNAEYRIPVKVPSVQPSYWKNRSFVRLQDISLSYNFDKSLLSKIGVQALSVSLTGKNLFTITGWKGWDPETGDGLVNAYPVMKSYSLGLNLTF